MHTAWKRAKHKINKWTFHCISIYIYKTGAAPAPFTREVGRPKRLAPSPPPGGGSHLFAPCSPRNHCTRAVQTTGEASMRSNTCLHLGTRAAQFQTAAARRDCAERVYLFQPPPSFCCCFLFCISVSLPPPLPRLLLAYPGCTISGGCGQGRPPLQPRGGLSSTPFGRRARFV